MLYTSIAVKNQVGVVVLSGKLGVSWAWSWRRYVRDGYMDVSGWLYVWLWKYSFRSRILSLSGRRVCWRVCSFVVSL